MNDEFNWKDKRQCLILIVIILFVILIVSMFFPSRYRMEGFLGLLVVGIMILGVFFFESILSKIRIKDSTKYGLSKADFNKNIDYYRDILDVKSPLIIGFIDDMNLEISEKELVSELLYLHENKIIDFQNDRIIKLNHGNTDDLLMSDRLFLSKIIDGKLKIKDDSFFLMRLRGEILQESKNKFGLVCNKKENYDKHIAICFILMFFGAFLKKVDFISDIISYIFVLIPLMYLNILWTCKTIESGKESKENLLIKIDVRKRTKEGEMLNKKIEGLKLFLKDYSLLKEKGTDSINIWGDYIIYSVLFGQNQKIVEEYKKYIE